MLPDLFFEPTLQPDFRDLEFDEPLYATTIEQFLPFEMSALQDSSAAGSVVTGPDLSVSGWTFDPAEIVQGQPFMVSVRVTNNGGKRSDPVTVRWRPGVNFVAPPLERFIGSLLPGATGSVTFEYPGYRSWYARLSTAVEIDPEGELAETEEQRVDNRIERTIVVRRRD